MRLFVSYSYIGKLEGQIYQGFHNMIGHRLMYPPSCPEHVEELHNVTSEHCCESLGMETATTTVLWWKQLDGG